MDMDFDDIRDMSIEESIELLNSKRKTADFQRKEIEKIMKAIETANNRVEEVCEIEKEEKEEDIEIDEDIDFEEEANYYFNEFEKLKEYDKESIEEILPPINYYNYERIVCRIIAKLSREIKYINEMIIATSSKQELELLKEDVITINDKRNTLKQMIQERYTEKTEERITNTLIFVPMNNNSEKFRVEDEIKDIPGEERYKFIELFDSIKDGTFKNMRRFANNDKLDGLVEVRGDQVRVAFIRLSKSCYAIISMFMKKQQNDNGYRKALKNKYSEYKNMEEIIKGKIKEEDYILKNKEFEEKLYEELSKNSIKGEAK